MGKIMVDLIGVTDRDQAHAEGWRPTCACTSASMNRCAAEAPVEILGGRCRGVYPCGRGGRHNLETAPLLLDAGASIIIVGGSIIKTEDVAGAARQVKQSMRSGAVYHR